MNRKFQSGKVQILMVTSLGAALSLTSLPASADDNDRAWAAIPQKPQDCQQPTKICFSIKLDPKFPALPYDGALALMRSTSSSVGNGMGIVSVINGVAMSPAPETFQNDPANLNWYSSPVTGTSYQVRGPRKSNKNSPRCERIQYSLDSIGGFTQSFTLPSPPGAEGHITQTVHSQMSLVYDPTDRSATISQIGKAARTCYYPNGDAMDDCKTVGVKSEEDINRIFPAELMNCDKLPTPQVPPLFIP